LWRVVSDMCMCMDAHVSDMCMHMHMSQTCADMCMCMHMHMHIVMCGRAPRGLTCCIVCCIFLSVSI
jgi:hypothetical protein